MRFVTVLLTVIACLILIQNGFAQTEENMDIIGHWPFGACNTIEIANNYFYIGNGAVLEIFNVGPLDEVEKVGEYIAGATIYDLKVQGDYAFIGLGDEGFEVVDISDPQGAYLIDSFWQHANNIVIDDHYLYASHGGTNIFDISDPTAPTIVHGFGMGNKIVINNNVIYFIGTYSILIGDFTDFENPQFYDYVTLDYTINDAVVVGNSLYVAVENTDGLQIFDVSDPVQPVFTASFNYSNQAVKCFATDNAYIYAAVDNHGLLVLNPLNLTTPTGALYQSFRSFRLRYNGGQIFAVDGSDNRIQQIDVSNPGLPAILGSYAAVGQGSVISCYNDLAFVGTWQDQLHIVDVSDPNQPTTLGHLDFPCNVTDIDMVEEYIYVGLNNSPGFQIYDLSNPEDPQGAGSLNFGSLAAETIVSGDYLLVAGWDSGFLMVDISEPLNPMIADQLQLSSACMNIAVEGDVVYAYAQSDNSFSIHVIDISDPYNLQELGSMSKSSDFLNNIAVYENTVYIAGDLGPDYGYGMIDVSDPTQPEYIGAIETDIFPRYNGIYVNGNYLYGLYGYEIRQYNLMNPQDPLLIGTIESFVGRDIDFNNDEMYVVTWRQGFIIAEVFSSNHIEETVESLVSHDFAVYPNPFNPQTTITFQIQTSAEVELSIYNSAGQQVSALINRSRLSAGIHDIRWDGSDDVGRKLSSGQYICHLSIDGQIQTTRMILLK